MLFAGNVWRLLTLRKVDTSAFPCGYKHVLMLWLGMSGILEISRMQIDYWFFGFGQSFSRLSGAVFIAHLAAWMLREDRELMRLCFVFILLTTPCLIFQELSEIFPVIEYSLEFGVRYILAAWAIVAAIVFLDFLTKCPNIWKKLSIYALIAIPMATNIAWNDVENYVAWKFSEPDVHNDHSVADPEALWTAQPALLADSLLRIPKESNSKPRTFILSLAADGSQQIFEREAVKVGQVLEKRYGKSGQALTFSNAASDVSHFPLADRANLTGALTFIGTSFDPARDLMIIYLTSHGSKSAELSTRLPDYSPLKPISAPFLAQVLRSAGIARRLVIVSACYSGTWIKPLASPNTIVLTASAADRTSFGCDDNRDYTNFGEAFIRSQSEGHLSLNEAFAKIKREIDATEADEKRVHSMPQAFVGENMGELWNAPQ